MTGDHPGDHLIHRPKTTSETTVTAPHGFPANTGQDHPGDHPRPPTPAGGGKGGPCKGTTLPALSPSLTTPQNLRYSTPVATWDAATKARALDLLQDGTTLADTHRQTEVPKPTLVRWAKAAGIDLERSTEKTRNATEAKRAQWAELREDVANHSGQTAQRILALVDQALDSGDLEVRSISQAKDAATTMAILADKAQLLSGDATTRSDHVGLRAQVLEQAQAAAPQLRAVS